MKKKVEIIFDNILFSSFESNSIISRFNLKQIAKKDIEYTHYFVSDVFSKEKLFKNDTPNFYLENKDVYDFISGGIFNLGKSIIFKLYYNDKRIDEKIKERNTNPYWIDYYKGKEKYLEKKNLSDLNKKIYLQGDFYDNFILKTKNLNKKYYTPIIIDKEYKFIVMASVDEDINLYHSFIDNYNKNYRTNFEIIEFVNYDGFEFVVITISKGNYSDLFYLGFHLALMEIRSTSAYPI
ncbi:MAG: hypothetical protein HRT67_13315 [Flavobacteriaceae bacterium]|nr:hypothetical protein [Flavobacteriaceae bacterium]